MPRLKMFAGILIFGVTATIASAQSPSRVDTSSWKTYRNETMGFTVKYPNTWHLRLVRRTMESVSLGRTPQVGQPNTSVQFIVQRKINPKGLPIRQWRDEQMQGKTAPPSLQFIDTTIGGRPAIRQEYTGTLGRSFNFFISLDKTDIFTIAINQPSTQTELDQTYEAVLSTVEFTK
jgi:hypothetical protein